MDGSTGGAWVVRGIVHCHSDLSYDCQTRIEDLRDTLLSEGFHFVALTEHDRGVTDDDYARFVARCRENSDDSFVVIPGLEVRCEDGIEVAAVGVTEMTDAATPERVVAWARARQGYSIWVHPKKRGWRDGRVVECDGIEVLNGKLDGTVAPDLGLVGLVKRRRRQDHDCHAIFGLDMHDLGQPRDSWIECEVMALSADGILRALREGRFVNRVANGTVTSFGGIAPLDRLLMTVLRPAYRCWDAALTRAPRGLNTILIRSTRRLVNLVKRRRKTVPSD